LQAQGNDIVQETAPAKIQALSQYRATLD